MANRRRSDSRRTPAPSSPASAGETAQSAATSVPTGPSTVQTASEARPARRRATSEPPPARISASAPRQGAGMLAPRDAREPISVSAEARRAMIAEAAYLRAERRGFAPGREEEDWLAAEKEVDVLLAAGQGEPQ